MKVEETNDEILYQERKYDPIGDIGDLSENTDIVEEDEPKHKDGDDVIRPKSSNNLKMLVPIGIIGFVIIVVVVVIAMSKKSSDKPSEEDYEHLDEMLASTDYYVEMFSYTDEEIEALRQAGYTGYEIEDNEFNEVPAEELLNEAAEQRKALYEKEIVPYLDAASDEFKELQDKTWLALDEFEIPEDLNENNISYVTSNVNVDYVKIGTLGMQCFIKYRMANGNVGFMTMTPDRYKAIDYSGNMVLNITYCTLSNGIDVITSAREVIVE